MITSQGCLLEVQICSVGSNISDRSRLPIERPIVPALWRSENSVVPQPVQNPRRMPLSALSHPTGPLMDSPASGTMTRA